MQSRFLLYSLGVKEVLWKWGETSKQGNDRPPVLSILQKASLAPPEERTLGQLLSQAKGTMTIVGRRCVTIGRMRRKQTE
jgi:hypothetical protein